MGRGLPQLWEGRPLHNGKEHLVVTVQRLGLGHAGDAPVKPTVRHLHRLTGILVVAGVGRTFIEGHDDVRPDDALDVHRALGGEQVWTAVDMAAEGHALLLDLAVLGQAVDLIASGVRQDGPVPPHESMESSPLLQHVQSRPEVKVIGVAQDDVGVHHIREHVLRHGFDRALGAHRHEDGRADGAVPGLQSPGTGAGMGILGNNGE